MAGVKSDEFFTKVPAVLALATDHRPLIVSVRLALGCQNVRDDMFFASLGLYQFVVQFQPKQDHHSRLLLRKSNVTFAEQKTTMG